VAIPALFKFCRDYDVGAMLLHLVLRNDNEIFFVKETEATDEKNILGFNVSRRFEGVAIG